MSVKKVNKSTGATTKVAGLVNSEKVNTMYGAFPSDASASNKLVSDATANEKISDAIADKADKVSSATNGNFAGLDASGNLTDSGKKPSDFQPALTFDNAPTENSNNPVKSGGIYADEKAIYEVMGKMGAKNLLPNAFSDKTIGGLAVTVDDNGVISIANGTANASGSLSSGALNYYLPAGKYILSLGDNTGKITNNGTFNIKGHTTDSDTIVTFVTFNYNQVNEKAFTINKDYIITEIYININSGMVFADGVVFYPMLRLASDIDNTFQPYTKTNQELTRDTNALAPMLNELGAKNLAPITLESIKAALATSTYTLDNNNQCTVNGVTLTVTLDSDGNVAKCNVNGTSSAVAYFRLWISTKLNYFGNELINSIEYPTKNGYTISSGTNSADVAVVYSGAIGNVYSGIYIRVESGKTVNTDVYPMLRYASITDDTYEPYAKTNQQLTEDTKALLDNTEVNGAVNILPIDLNYIKANNSASSWSGNACTHNGVTYTIDEANGKITVNGTASARSTLQVYAAIAGDLFKKSFKYLAKVFNNNFNIVNGYYVQLYMTNSPYTRIDAFTGNNFVVPDSFFDNNIRVSIQIVVENGKSVDNQVITPLIAFGNYTGGFEKYAKSNRELTEKIDDLNGKYILNGQRFIEVEQETGDTYAALFVKLLTAINTSIASLGTNERLEVIGLEGAFAGKNLVTYMYNNTNVVNSLSFIGSAFTDNWQSSQFYTIYMSSTLASNHFLISTLKSTPTFAYEMASATVPNGYKFALRCHVYKRLVTT